MAQWAENLTARTSTTWGKSSNGEQAMRDFLRRSFAAQLPKIKNPMEIFSNSFHGIFLLPQNHY